MSDASAAAAVSARIDRLPASPELWSWIARLSFGAFFEIYEVALTSVISPGLVAAGIFKPGATGLFGLPDQATFSFATFAGLFIGTIGFSQFADRFGRRPIFTFSLIWYAIATIVMGCLSSAEAICLWRFIAAIGIGAEIIAIDCYVAELMPKAVRGRGFAISKSIQYAAVPIAGILGVVFISKAVAGSDGWRYLAFFPALGAVLIWWIRRGLPESPRWLAEHGREVEALAIVRDLEDRICLRTDTPLSEPAIVAQPTSEDGSFAALFRSPLRRRLIVISIGSAAATIAFYGFGSWLPSLLEAQGVTITKSLIYSAAIALAYPLSPLLFTVFADRIERKWQMVAGGLLSALCGILFSFQQTAAGWIVFGVLITAANNLSSYAAHTYRGELFPTEVRARAVGIAYAFDRAVAAFNSYAIGFLLVAFDVRAVFIFLGAALLLDVLVIGLFGPRTNGLAMEEITT